MYESARSLPGGFFPAVYYQALTIELVGELAGVLVLGKEAHGADIQVDVLAPCYPLFLARRLSSRLRAR